MVYKNNESIYQILTEIYKSISQINPDFMRSHFIHGKLHYSLRIGFILNLPRINSTYYGTSAVHFRETLNRGTKNNGIIDCGCLLRKQ